MISFKLKSIHRDEFATIKDVPKGKKITVAHQFTFAASAEQHEILMIFSANFLSDDKPFILSKVTCEFTIKKEDFESWVVKDLSQIKVPKDFLIHLASITTGTARGIIHEKLQGSEYSKYLLPLLDISRLPKGDLIINLSNKLAEKDS